MVVIAAQVLDSHAQLVDYNLDVFSSAAGIVDLPSVQWHENDAKWQHTDVSGFYHAFQIHIYTEAFPDVACSTPVRQLYMCIHIVSSLCIPGVKKQKKTTL